MRSGVQCQVMLRNNKLLKEFYRRFAIFFPRTVPNYMQHGLKSISIQGYEVKILENDL